MFKGDEIRHPWVHAFNNLPFFFLFPSSFRVRVPSFFRPIPPLKVSDFHFSLFFYYFFSGGKFFGGKEKIPSIPDRPVSFDLFLISDY